MRKLIVFFVIILLVAFFRENCIYAGFADYTDEDAAQDEKKMIQEQNEKFDTTKSNNNYLRNLYITGGVLSPDFERQTVEYTFKLEKNINEINITAIPEDADAIVKGTGTINTDDVSEFKIDVISASGTTRTYSIRTIKQSEKNIEDNNLPQTEMNKNEFVQDRIIQDRIIQDQISENTNTKQEKIQSNGKNDNSKIKVIKGYIKLIIVIITAILFIYIIIKLYINRKR